MSEFSHGYSHMKSVEMERLIEFESSMILTKILDIPAGWLSYLEHPPVQQKVVDSISGQGTYLGCGFDHWLRHILTSTN